MSLQDTEAKVFHTISLVFSIVPQIHSEIANSCSIPHMVTKELPVGKLVTLAAFNDLKIVSSEAQSILTSLQGLNSDIWEERSLEKVTKRR